MICTVVYENLACTTTRAAIDRSGGMSLMTYTCL